MLVGAMMIGFLPGFLVQGVPENGGFD